MPYLQSFVRFIHCVKLFSAFQLEYVQYCLTSVASEKADLQGPQANTLDSTLSPCGQSMEKLDIPDRQFVGCKKREQARDGYQETAQAGTWWNFGCSAHHPLVLMLGEMCSEVVGVWQSTGVPQIFIRESILWCNKNYYFILQIPYFSSKCEAQLFRKGGVLGGFSFQYAALQISVTCPKAI